MHLFHIINGSNDLSYIMYQFYRPSVRGSFHALAILALCSLLACSPQVEIEDTPVSSDFLLPTAAVPEYEKYIDHAAYIQKEYDWRMDFDANAIYRTHCYNCHGNEEHEGSLPNSKKFWKDQFKNGNDPYSMYQTLTRGFGQMPPQVHLAPSQKYEVIHFIREKFLKEHNPDQYFEVDDEYLASLPKGDSLGPEPVAYQPWAEMDYGNWLIKCYEMSDDEDPPKYISGGRAPLPYEDYSQVNFAYKGIAIRIDPGDGGVAAGKNFVMFDHDLLRFVGSWSGEGFIDWDDILLNDKHNIYPRTVGTRAFANPITPGWANPETGDFEDPRIVGLDGRKFGPLPRDWAHYKGLYRHDEKVIIKYTVGDADVLEMYELERDGDFPIVSRTLNIQASSDKLKLRILPSDVPVTSNGYYVEIADGFSTLEFEPNNNHRLKIYMGGFNQDDLEDFTTNTRGAQNLEIYTRGGDALYSEVLTSPIQTLSSNDAYEVDVFVLPQTNPWNSRLRPTGIDFINGGNDAVICTIDGEVWYLEDIQNKTGSITWRRIATGLFQPLGIKVVNGDIYVGCRDQIAILRDLNGDGETDYYESFNSDHQVTEHFHEFAMGLQSDDEGNFYYAKSGRHARESLVPQHGTLIKVSPDGETSEIIANGFRAANGVCLNPDGSFYVTDQEGYWNPMNRINRVTEGGFYGNMWGYGAPADSSDAAMIQPMCWIDMKYDRSPAELLWADSEKWGPLNGSLLNLSYGYGKIFIVFPEEKGDIHQGAMMEMPIPQFPTGLMRGRFNPDDGQFYGCGMSAWATNQLIQSGGLYRVRYTGRPANVPVSLHTFDQGITLNFSDALDPSTAANLENYTLNTWQLKRSKRYGSDRYDEKEVKIDRIEVSDDLKEVNIFSSDLVPTWIYELLYSIKSESGKDIEGAIQGSIYQMSDQKQKMDI